MEIYCGNLPFESTEDDIAKMFAAYGEVKKTALVTNKYSGKSRGFAFVTMVDESAGQASIEALDGTDLLGRKLQVGQARPKRSFE